MKQIQPPNIVITKEAISKGDEHLHCCLCSYGKKAGRILWRIDFTGEFLGFHWLLCNRCRFLFFAELGGKMLEGLGVETENPPRQKISKTGKIRSSYYWSCSWDRREVMDKGGSVKEYDEEHRRELEKLKLLNQYIRCCKCDKKILNADGWYVFNDEHKPSKKKFCKDCAKKKKKKIDGLGISRSNNDKRYTK